MLELDKIYNMDCLEGMRDIPDKGVDMVLSDLPYGCLECAWDKPLVLPVFWEQTNRVIKDNGAIVLTANMRFAIDLINSNKRYFRYDLIWEKSMAVGFANCNRMPMRNHELILLFYKRLPVYNPQGVIDVPPRTKQRFKREPAGDGAYPERSLNIKPYTEKRVNYPRSVMRFEHGNAHKIHPTQKPLEMFKYFILTYSRPGDVVLDTCMGSGTTAAAAIETGRRYIGFETNELYYQAANERIENYYVKNA